MRHPDDGLIEEYLDGELPAEARGEFEAHAAGCDACHERIEAARAARSEAEELVALLGEPEARAHTDELPASLRPTARRPIRWRTLAWAASLVMAAGLGYVGGTTAGREAGQSDGRTVGRSDGRVADEVPAERRNDGPRNQLPGRPPARPTDAAAGPPTVRNEEAAPLAKQRVDGELASPREAREEVRLADADRAAAGRAPPAIQPSSRPTASLDDAVRALGGSIRLVDGLEVQRVDVVRLPMPGGDSAAVVQLTYADAAGHPIVLRQSRTVTAIGQLAGADAARAQAAAPDRDRALASEMPGRRAAEPSRDGELTWVDGTGFRLVLRADADADSLARLRARVR